MSPISQKLLPGYWLLPGSGTTGLIGLSKICKELCKAQFPLVDDNHFQCSWCVTQSSGYPIPGSGYRWALVGVINSGLLILVSSENRKILHIYEL